MDEPAQQSVHNLETVAKYRADIQLESNKKAESASDGQRFGDNEGSEDDRQCRDQSL